MLLEKQCEYGISGACLISGLYNLQPIQLCSVNDVLKMDEALMRINSPVTFRRQQIADSCCSWTAETMSLRIKAGVIQQIGKTNASIDLLELPALNHFPSWMRWPMKMSRYTKPCLCGDESGRIFSRL